MNIIQCVKTTNKNMKMCQNIQDIVNKSKKHTNCTKYYNILQNNNEIIEKY